MEMYFRFFFLLLSFRRQFLLVTRYHKKCIARVARRGRYRYREMLNDFHCPCYYCSKKFIKQESRRAMLRRFQRVFHMHVDVVT